jgi:predicted PurR-regulated permease PerM
MVRIISVCSIALHSLARQLLMLFFTAIVLAVAISQLVKRFQQFGLKRVWAVWLSLGIVITLLTGVFLLILPQFVEQFRQLLTLLPTGIDRIQQSIDWLEKRFAGADLPGTPESGRIAISYLRP